MLQALVALWLFLASVAAGSLVQTLAVLCPCAGLVQTLTGGLVQTLAALWLFLPSVAAGGLVQTLTVLWPCLI